MNKIIITLFTLSLALNSVWATGPTGAAPTAGTVVQGQAKAAGIKAVEKTGATDSIGDFFASSAGVAVISGISTVFSGVLYKAAAEQEEEAEANIVKIDRIMATFKDSFLYYCPQGRESLNEPNCYCYTEDGTENPNRTKSQICIDLWAKNKYRITAEAGDYSRKATGFIDPVGCLTVNGQFDEACKCKKLINSNGNNACMKSSSISIPAGSFGAAFLENTGVKDVMKLAAGSTSGNPNFNSFNAGVLGLKAIQTRKLNDSIMTKLQDSNQAAKFKQVNEGNVLDFAKAVLGEKALANAIASSSSPLATASSAPADANTASILKKAAAKAGFEFSGGHGLQNKKAPEKESFFNLGGETAGNSGGTTQNFPDQEKIYKYKGDITKDSGSTIFEIISNRYIQSGLKRLFEH
ncbi:MAG: hypothetical protein WC635_00080 [Bacteriovorax sp.]|jgi:hypothetical protein